MDHVDAIRVTKEWSGIEYYPECADSIDTLVTGNLFSRGFEVAFECEPSELENWANYVSSLGGAYSESAGHFEKIYLVSQRGSQFAQVMVDWLTGRAHIKVYWS